MQSLPDIKAKLLLQWQKFRFHREWLQGDLRFPLQIKLKRPTDKVMLHEFARVQNWQKALENACESHTGLSLHKQEIQFSTMGRQIMPVYIEIESIETLARFCGKWQQWQQFERDIQLLDKHLPMLKQWRTNAVNHIVKYAGQWPQLIAICDYFLQHPRPGCYVRELPIAGVDSKFIENRKQIVKTLLDEVLPESAINGQFERVSDNGFEQRFGLKYQQPTIRFRLLDPMLYFEFNGASDISLPLEQFSALDLLIDKVFITENLTNGLAFPKQNNSIVIFGKGYGIQALKHIGWLKQCKIIYWGDIDTDGFVMLSQIRGYFNNTQSLLMNEATLIACKAFWGEESVNKKATPDTLKHLTENEAQLYHKLKTDHWQPRLRLEQERVPFELLQQALNKGRGGSNDG